MGTESENSPAAGGPPPEPSTPPASPQPPGAASDPTPPPAAEVVVTAQRSEAEVKLEQELEVERVTRKQREQRINQLEDENRTLKGTPRAKPDKSGWTFFH